MKTVIVCASVSHGNTRKIAEVMAEVLGAKVVTPEQADPAEVAAADLAAFGSGIFYSKFHPTLLDFVRSLPAPTGTGRATIFATSGLPELKVAPFTRPLLNLLTECGYTVEDSFDCRAYDTWTPFKLLGGINKNRPNETDLALALGHAELLRG